MSNNNANHLTDAIGEPARQFRGYTLQQMRARKAVNQVRIELQQQKLINAVSNRREVAEQPGHNLAGTIENVFRYAQIALYSYKVARRAMNLYQSFRRAR